MSGNALRLTAALVAVAIAVAVGAPTGAAAERMGIGQIGAALPTVADLAGAGLERRSAEPIGTATRRAPHPCPAYRARGVRDTARWGEWEAAGRGRTARVLVFSYADATIERTWASLEAAIRACPAETRVVEDDGSRGIAVQIVREASATAIELEIRTRSAGGQRAWSRDRAIVYQRVGDAIIKAQVSRRVLRAGDRALVRRIARVSRAKYLSVRADPQGSLPAAERQPDDLVGDVVAPIARAIAGLPAGARLNVSIGDSFISGEAGRWRGNVFWHANWPRADEYGEEAYWDTPTGEAIWGCHRGKGAEIHVPGTQGLNLACSGAITTSVLRADSYKPGIDDGLVDPATGERLPGQLTLLGEVARQAPIGTVVLSIGGNDMGFSSVILSCMSSFLRPWPFEAQCKDDASVRSRLSDASLAEVGGKVEAAIVRVHDTMEAAGYADGSWQLIVQGYPRPIAEDSRYGDTYADKLYAGGCPFHSADIRWINTRIPTMAAELRQAAERASATTGQPVRFMDLTAVFAGRELCAKGAEHVDRMAPSAVTARAERVQMVRVFSPFAPAEAVHPNQLGQQALQACLREALNGGQARSGRCDAPLDWSQVDATGLPLVRFTPAP